MYAWFKEGDTHPVTSYNLNGRLDFLWKSEEDAHGFMEEYIKNQGVTDLSQYRLYEIKVSGVKNGETVMDFTTANQLLEVGEVEPPAGELD